MVDLSSAPVLGFLGGIFGGTVAQGWAFLRRRKRHLDRLRSVLKEIRGISKYQLEDADNGHSEMSDDDLCRLEEALKQARLEASYLLSDGQREKIDKVENQFGYLRCYSSASHDVKEFAADDKHGTDRGNCVQDIAQITVLKEADSSWVQV